MAGNTIIRNGKKYFVWPNGTEEEITPSAPDFSFDPKAPATDLYNIARDRFLSGAYQDTYDVLHSLLKRQPDIVSDPSLGPNFQRLLRRTEVQLGAPLTEFPK